MRCISLPNLLIYLIVCPGEVVEKLPEPITPRKRQYSIGEFLCTMYYPFLDNLITNLKQTNSYCRSALSISIMVLDSLIASRMS
jgi:hypothetical protein